MSYILFNDISYAQGLYDMDSDPNAMIMMKASGFYTVAKTPYLDSQLVNNYASATRLGKVPFMYHFAGGADPVVEASYFATAVAPITVGDGYALDFEIDTDDNPGWCLAFLDHFTQVVGTAPWWYIDRDRRSRGDWSAVSAKYGEWIAAPDVPFDANIANVGMYIAQQGPIVNGHDTDMFFGTLEQAKAYTHQAVPPPAEPIPTRVAPAPTPTTTVPPVVAPIPVPEPPTTPPVPELPNPEAPPKEPVPTPGSVGFFYRLLKEFLAIFGIRI